METVFSLVCWLGLAFGLLHMMGLDAYAQEGADGQAQRPVPLRFEMDEVVVTANRIKEPIRRIPRNVTVITSEDIEQASSNNVVDLLVRESSVNLRSFYGHDKSAGIDIRGMGDTSSSNVIVIVDGVKLNPPDLSGPDFASVPLDSIERIEIVRGAGSVIYGDGAVAGVINIITKKRDKQPQVRAYTSYGSDETLDGRTAFSGRINRLGFNVNAAYYDTNGYRDNGFFRKKDVNGWLGYDLGDAITVSLSSSYHNDDNGLPGGVSKEDRDSKERRTGTNRPDDAGETTDRRYGGRVEIDFVEWGSVDIRGGYRDRDNAFVLGFNPLLTREAQTDAIHEETKNARLHYDLLLKLFDLDQRFRFGVDYTNTEYVRQERSKDNRENSETDNLGVFVAADSALSKDLSLRVGYRTNDFNGDFRTDTRQIFGSTKRWVNGTPSGKKWSNHAEEIGVVYSYRPELSFFASYATTFRVPNVDELAQVLGELNPQEGRHLEIGGKIRYGGILECGLTFFEMKIDDEIFFDGNLELNSNFEDKTVRRGIETDVRLNVDDAIYLWGNYTYTHAKFDNRDTWVPLVPEHMARAGIEWKIREALVLSVTGTYVGPRFDGNDQNNNRFDKLDGYSVWDTKVIYQHKGVKVFAGVNNIFDRLYSTVAYSEVYYPMPERNFYGGVEWTF